jgi:hypothetical protein
MSAKFNYSQMKKELSASYKKAIQKDGLILAKEILEENKNLYIKEIENHPVSQELNEGPDGENLSDTLAGKENLFAFIGFDSNRKPVKELTDFIKDNTSLDRKFTFDKAKLELKFNVNTPSLDEIKSATPLPFENGNSWVKGIEDGISGFGYYIYSTFFNKSRSKRGLQSKNKVRSVAFRSVKYMSDMYEKFIKNLK